MFERSLCALLAVALTFAGAELAEASAPPTSASPPSASESSDEVRLQSGGFVRGRIVEYMPGEYVVILPTGQSETRRFEWSDVAEVVRESDASAPGIPGGPPPGVPGQTLAPGGTPVPDGPGSIPEGVPGGVPGDLPAGVPGQTPVSDDPAPVRSSEGPTPSPSHPALTMEQVKGKNPAVLYHIDHEAVGFGAGVSIRAIAYSELCRAPCSGVLESRGGEFFVGGRGYGPSKRFRLEGMSSSYSLRVTPRPKALIWLGYVTMIGFVSGGVALASVPIFVDMPKTVAPGFYAGGAVIGALGVAGGITMLVFSRTKVEILPDRPR